MLKKNNKNIDYDKLNEGITIGVKILKILLVFIIVASIFVVTKILIDWKVIPIVGSFLKILSPLFIGIALAWLFDPIVTKLQHKGVRRVIGSLFVYIIFILFLFLLGNLLIPNIVHELSDLSKQVPDFINYLQDGIDDFFDEIEKFGDYDFTKIKDNIYKALNDLGDRLTSDAPENIMNGLTAFISGSITFLIGMLVGLYMLFDFDSVKKHIKSLVPKRYQSDVFTLGKRLNTNLKSYVHGTFLIMLILFVLELIALSIAGIKAPLVFALFCAITDLIPYIGPYIGAVPAVLVGFSMSSTTGICVLVAVIICQILENYFLQPVVMGKTMKLHPVTIMIGLLVFNYFFGIIGMILATPTIAVLKTIFVFFNEKYHFMDKINNS